MAAHTDSRPCRCWGYVILVSLLEKIIFQLTPGLFMIDSRGVLDTSDLRQASGPVAAPKALPTRWVICMKSLNN